MKYFFISLILFSFLTPLSAQTIELKIVEDFKSFDDDGYKSFPE